MTELLDDVALGSAPLDAKAARRLLEKLRIVQKMKTKPSDKALAAMATSHRRFLGAGGGVPVAALRASSSIR